MVLLLTILSVLAVWAFLTVLVLGLLVVLKALESVRRNLEQIAMGVRAIERETAPLGAAATTLLRAVDDTTGAIDELGVRLDHAGQQLARAAPGTRHS